MYERIITVNNTHWDFDREWVVLDEGFRDVVFTATVKGPDGFQECYRWLRDQCPNGKCES